MVCIYDLDKLRAHLEGIPIWNTVVYIRKFISDYGGLPVDLDELLELRKYLFSLAIFRGNPDSK